MKSSKGDSCLLVGPSLIQTDQKTVAMISVLKLVNKIHGFSATIVKQRARIPLMATFQAGLTCRIGAWLHDNKGSSHEAETSCQKGRPQYKVP